MPKLLWTQRQDIGPKARDGCGMAFDPLRKRQSYLAERIRIVAPGSGMGTIGLRFRIWALCHGADVRWLGTMPLNPFCCLAAWRSAWNPGLMRAIE